jgi:hypothetical protein
LCSSIAAAIAAYGGAPGLVAGRQSRRLLVGLGIVLKVPFIALFLPAGKV